jgi:succinate dehydrogenase / fumarate reductase flavoprotein subunit
VLSVSGPRTYNPGWNLATDLPAMLTVSRLTTKGAIVRRESRGGHTRDDYPLPDPELGTVNLVQRVTTDGQYTLDPEPLPQMPAELRTLFEEDAH